VSADRAKVGSLCWVVSSIRHKKPPPASARAPALGPLSFAMRAVLALGMSAAGERGHAPLKRGRTARTIPLQVGPALFGHRIKSCIARRLPRRLGGARTNVRLQISPTVPSSRHPLPKPDQAPFRLSPLRWLAQAHVSGGSKPEMTVLKTDFGSTPKTGHRRPSRPCQFRANSRLMHRSK
jgi:hypothetical protein